MKIVIEVEENLFKSLQMFSELNHQSIESILTQEAISYVENALNEIKLLNLIKNS
jgi:hypothetical protein